MLRRHIKIFTIIGLALIVRLFFVSFPPFKSDMDSFIAWGEQMFSGGPGNFYRSGIWSDYAPGYMYFMWLVAIVKHSLFPTASRETYEFLHKCVPVFFDLATGLLLYKIMRWVTRSYGQGERLAHYHLPEIVAGVYVFSPFTFFTSALWGQVDSVYVFFLLLSFYYLLRRNFSLAVIVYVVAGVIKPQAIVLAPLYLLAFIKERNWRLLLTSGLYGVITFYVLTMPFFGLAAIQGIWKLLDSSINVYPYTSINTFNYWGIFGFWKSDTTPIVAGLTGRTIGYLVWGLTLIYGFYFGLHRIYTQKHHLDAKNASFLACFFIFSAVMFLTRMHERYLFPLFVYFILAAGIYTYHVLHHGGDTRRLRTVYFIWFLYGIVMLLHWINLYYVYVFYLYFLQEPRVNVPDSNIFYHWVESIITTWSYLQLVAYGLFVFSLPYYLKRFAHIVH